MIDTCRSRSRRSAALCLAALWERDEGRPFFAQAALERTHGNPEPSGDLVRGRAGAEHRRCFVPGARYGYSNLSYWLLGRVVERASGQPYARFIEREIFAPLHIDRAELGFDVERPEQLARGHERRFSPVGLLVPLLTDAATRSESHGGWLRFADVTVNGPAYGGAFASARGYGKFLADLLRDEPRLLSPEAKRLFFSTEHDSQGRELPTTLGWHRGELKGVPYFDKPGGGPGSSANLRIYPTLRIATVWLSNRMRVSEGSIRALSDELDAPLLDDARRAAPMNALATSLPRGW